MIENRDKIQIREISYNTPDYTKELVLRDKVLRKPLGMSLYDANLDAEKDDVHIGAFVNNDMVGVLILTKLNADEIKMRQVAVDEDWRSLNIGRALVVFAEESSKMKGFKTMLLNARNLMRPLIFTKPSLSISAISPVCIHLATSITSPVLSLSSQ